ncbi:MAG: DUF2867 domain-containing protein [Acidobacteriota bacterium]
MREIRADGFRQKPLRVHSILAGIPLRTLSRVDLPGGREGMAMPEISRIIGFGDQGEVEVGPIAKALFWLRGMLGRVFHWDDVKELFDSVSYLSRLSKEDRARSLVTPGKGQGISRVLYCFENELLAEIVNRTVHCFWLMASERTATGYALYLAVYVKKLNWFTPIYMALVSPMLKWVIYPSMEKGVKRRWAKEFPAATNGPGIKRGIGLKAESAKSL